MDLLECPACTQRYLHRDAGNGAGWLCGKCGEELRLIVRSIPGEVEHMREALHAHHLTPISSAEAEPLKRRKADS